MHLWARISEDFDAIEVLCIIITGQVTRATHRI